MSDADAEPVVGQAGPQPGNLRAGPVAGRASGASAAVTGGVSCPLAVARAGTTASGLCGGRADS
ncbi:hypothetical protein [Streptomyces sp. SCL15-4]|uniref:hypothetical protein n=1 Tax=Streptomyces sp. SCL15-4 TaxID=2967221 RepID=UPI0029662008|nr:hypothetical protein [Streptomyces sp. SCL15-4]